MSDHTAIEWCDATLNCWWGCTKVSDGCKFCYAEHLADHRYNKGNWGPTGTRQEVKSWRSTLNKISKRAKVEGRRLKVFCQSMSDTFEGPETMGGVESENYYLVCRLQLELMMAVADHPELDFLLLTKRPENVMPTIRRMRYHNTDEDIPGFQDRLYDPLLYPWTGGMAPKNVWIGTSVEDQKTADERIPHLLEIPAAVRFLSCEPLLGPIRFANVPGFNLCGQAGMDLIRNFWVICGGESGPNARPMHPDWAKSLRDQCQAAGVPFFFKQWGEWTVSDPFDTDDPMTHQLRPASYLERFNQTDLKRGWGPFQIKSKVGKKRAGRLIDGRTWDEFPVVTP